MYGEWQTLSRNTDTVEYLVDSAYPRTPTNKWIRCGINGWAEAGGEGLKSNPHLRSGSNSRNNDNRVPFFFFEKWSIVCKPLYDLWT